MPASNLTACARQTSRLVLPRSLMVCSQHTPTTTTPRTKRNLHTPSRYPTPPTRASRCSSQTQPSQQHRTYYTPSSPPPAPFNPTETAILAAAITHVPTHGFTQSALALGAETAGYLPASTNLFPSGAFDLVRYHLVTQRLALADSVQFPTPATNTTPASATTYASSPVSSRIRTLLLARLRANEPILHKLPDMLALMSLAGNIPTSLAELGRLSDEILYLAGDLSVDSSWYTKRGALAGVYAAAEVFQSQDRSLGCVETERFVDRRLEDVRRAGAAVGSVGEWVGFTGMSTVNVLRSFGVRI